MTTPTFTPDAVHRLDVGPDRHTMAGKAWQAGKDAYRAAATTDPAGAVPNAFALACAEALSMSCPPHPDRILPVVWEGAGYVAEWRADGCPGAAR